MLFVGVNPAQSLPLPAVPVRLIETPSIVVGADGTNFPNILFSSFIESFVLSVFDMVNAPLLKPPVGVPIVTSPATLPVRFPVTSPVTGPTKLPDVTMPDNTNAVETPTS